MRNIELDLGDLKVETFATHDDPVRSLPGTERVGPGADGVLLNMNAPPTDAAASCTGCTYVGLYCC